MQKSETKDETYKLALKIDSIKQELISLPFITIDIKAAPASNQSACTDVMADGSLKIHLKNPPVEGKANRELISLLSTMFEIPQDKIEIIRGKFQRNKTVKLSKI